VLCDDEGDANGEGEGELKIRSTYLFGQLLVKCNECI
jgi:hypothetical protein